VQDNEHRRYEWKGLVGVSWPRRGSYSGNCLSRDVNIQPEVVVKTYQFLIHVTKQKITLLAAYYYCVTLLAVGHHIRSRSKKSDNSSSERVEEFKYLATTITNQNSIQEEIRNKPKSGNACRIFFLQFAIQKSKD
jgi:hypothetical protein